MSNKAISAKSGMSAFDAKSVLSFFFFYLLIFCWVNKWIGKNSCSIFLLKEMCDVQKHCTIIQCKNLYSNFNRVVVFFQRMWLDYGLDYNNNSQVLTGTYAGSVVLWTIPRPPWRKLAYTVCSWCRYVERKSLMLGSIRWEKKGINLKRKKKE